MTRIDDILRGYIEAARSELKRSGMRPGSLIAGPVMMPRWLRR